jgi:ketosteroid isomerase-like protein
VDLATLLAKAEIRDLIDNYTHAVCGRDVDLFASLWAEESRWSIGDIPDLTGISGRDAIVAHWEAGMARHPEVFLMCNPVAIAVKGDRATTCTYSFEVIRDDRGHWRRASGRYDDGFVRIDGCWLFESRAWSKIHSEDYGAMLTFHSLKGKSA